MTLPLPVIQFAKDDSLDGIVPAVPISWAERDDAWVIVYEDGRKITHFKTEKRQVEHDNKTSRSGNKQDRKE